MNMTEMVPTLTNKIDIGLGICVAFLVYIFGEHYILFVGFMILNLIDYVTGCMKARTNKVSNSEKGLNGILKKFGYWIIIGVSFLMAVLFNSMGDALGIDLGISIMIGYATLATLIINELRSIFENLVECGYHPPKVLIKGLEVANKMLEGEEDEEDGGESK